MNSREPRVSVIMGVFDGLPAVRAAVSSILDQSYADFELVVIDDGSKDGTAAFLDALADSRVVVVHQDNQGLTRSLNTAIGLCRREYVARMDADDYSEPDRLRSQVEYLDSHLSVVCVGTQFLGVDEEGAELGYDRLPTDPAEVASVLRSTGNCLVHGSLMVRRSALESIGRYDTAFRYAQDYDLLLRLLGVGEVANLPDRLYRLTHALRSITVAHAGAQRAYARMARERAAGGLVNLEEPAIARGSPARQGRRMVSDLLDGYGSNYWRDRQYVLARRRFVESLSIRPTLRTVAHLLCAIAPPALGERLWGLLGNVRHGLAGPG